MYSKVVLEKKTNKKTKKKNNRIIIRFKKDNIDILLTGLNQPRQHHAYSN